MFKESPISNSRSHYFQYWKYRGVLHLLPEQIDLGQIRQIIEDKYFRPSGRLSLAIQKIAFGAEIPNDPAISKELVDLFFASELPKKYQYFYSKFQQHKNNAEELIDAMYCVCANRGEVASISWDDTGELSVLNVYKKNRIAGFFTNSDRGSHMFSLPLSTIDGYVASSVGIVFRLISGAFQYHGHVDIDNPSQWYMDKVNRFNFSVLKPKDNKPFVHPSWLEPETSTNTEKVVVSCPNCKKKCRIPGGGTFEVTCPQCTHKWVSDLSR